MLCLGIGDEPWKRPQRDSACDNRRCYTMPPFTPCLLLGPDVARGFVGNDATHDPTVCMKALELVAGTLLGSRKFP